MTTTYIPIQESVISGRRLGRHVYHDSRSLQFQVIPEPRRIGSKTWIRRTPILDQGDLGSCTGNAAAGVLGSDPFFGTLPPTWHGDEHDALDLYSLATQLDPYPGSYPGQDTGSDGLSVAKACKQMGLISGYKHGVSLDSVLTGLQNCPGIVGTNWLTGMDSPDANGIVQATGTVRGGHEYELFECDLPARMLFFWNSWGTGFGIGGKFGMSFDNFSILLAQAGDATFFVSVTNPAPTPIMPSIVHEFTPAQDKALSTWAERPHLFHNSTIAAKAWNEAVK